MNSAISILLFTDNRHYQTATFTAAQQTRLQRCLPVSFYVITWIKSQYNKYNLQYLLMSVYSNTAYKLFYT